MATLHTAPTRHHHTEQVNGILTNQHLTGPNLKREGGMGKKGQHKMASNFVYKSQGAPTRGIGPPPA